MAAFCNDTSKLQELISASPSLRRDLNKESCCFRLKPLHFAVWGGSRRAFVLLVCAGARFEKKDISKNRARVHFSMPLVSLMEMASGKLDPDDCGGKELVRKGEIDRPGVLRDLERGFVLKPWAWEVRRLLLIRDGELAVLPKDICRLLVRKYCFDQIPIFE
jgi:hypothetical protein